MSQAKRLTPKEYEELLKIMRKWPEPYLGTMAKVIYHLNWMFKENERLDTALKKLQQTAFLEHRDHFLDPPPAPIQIKVEAYNAGRERGAVEAIKWPLPKRLKHIFDTDGLNSEAWRQTLKWNALSEDEALKIISDTTAP